MCIRASKQVALFTISVVANSTWYTFRLLSSHVCTWAYVTASLCSLNFDGLTPSASMTLT